MMMFLRESDLRCYPTSFEFIEVALPHPRRDSCSAECMLYRSPTSTKNRAPFSMLIEKFSDLLNRVSPCTGRLLIVGDFNIHWDLVDHYGTNHFL